MYTLIVAIRIKKKNSYVSDVEKIYDGYEMLRIVDKGFLIHMEEE